MRKARSHRSFIGCWTAPALALLGATAFSAGPAWSASENAYTACDASLSIQVAGFETNSAVLAPAMRRLLSDFKNTLEGRRCKILITGYSSADGPPEWNRTLAEQRARAVADFLLTLETARAEDVVVGSEAETVSYGAGAQNRRVSVRVEPIQIAAAPSPARRPCRSDTELSVAFAEGASDITDDQKAQLVRFLSQARQCSFQVSATASPAGENEALQSVAEARRESVAEFLRQNGVEAPRIVEMPAYVDEAAASPDAARAAVVRAYPRQGLVCSLAAVPVQQDQLELWFAAESAVISGERLRDLSDFAAKALDSDCNIEIVSYAAKEVVASDAREQRRMNRQIARERSRAVRAALQAAGLPAQRVIIRTFEYIGDQEDNKPSARRTIIKYM
jgi:outer membrane protein OmpA-like peptidoglycan-associated protein